VACSLSCSKNKNPRYKNRAFEFFIHYEPTWEMKERVGSALVVFLVPKGDKLDLFRENMTITVQDLAQPISLAEYTRSVEEMIKAIGQQTPDTTSSILESVPVQISGKPGHKIIYTMTQYGNPPEFIEKGIAPRVDSVGETVQMMLAWVIREDRVYLFTYVAQKNSFDAYIKDVDAMLRSFRFI